MKKLLAVLFALCIPFAAVASADESVPEMVVQKTIIIKMYDVIREGTYTGEMQNGVPHGYGIFEAINSTGLKWHYVGAWLNGAMTGEGAQYWDSGDNQIGLFENGELICGDRHNSSGRHSWIDNRPDDQGRIRVKLYRTDDTLYFDGYVDSEQQALIGGIFYNKNGQVFFEGTIGNGFDWDYIYID